MTTLAGPEQLLLEMINRARMDPEAEAARLSGVLGRQFTLNENIPAGSTISSASKQVLAGNSVLAGVAENHSLHLQSATVLTGGGDPHSGTGDKTPQARIADAGYLQNNIAFHNENVEWNWRSPTFDLASQTQSLHNTLFEDNPANHSGEIGGHRLTMMDDNAREVGIGVVYGTVSGQSNAIVVTENFGVSGTQSFLTGVVYNDTKVVDNFYSLDEGVQGVTATVTSGGTTIGSDTTGSGGGWSVGEPGGTYTVTFSGGGLAAPVSATVEGGNRNAKVDLVNGNEIFANVNTTLGAGATELHFLGMDNVNGTGNASDNVIVGNKGNNVPADSIPRSIRETRRPTRSPAMPMAP